MKKAIIVAKQELKNNLRRKGFLFGVIGFPLLIVSSFFLPVLFIQELGFPEEVKVGVVDNSGILSENYFEVPKIEKIPFLNASSERKIVFVKFSSEEEAEKAFEEGKIYAYYVIPENFEESFTVKKKSRGFFSLDKELELKLAEKYGDLAYKFAKGIDFEEIKEEERSPFDFLASYFIPLLLFLAIFTSSGYLMQGIVEEKESRIMEILFSSASPEEIFFGKFLGNAITGLIQASVWLALAGYFSIFLISTNLLSLGVFIVSMAYFIFGYIFYASLLSAIASVSSSLRDSQQIASAIVFAALFPSIFLLQIVSMNPDSALLKAFALLPLTSPVLMPALYSSNSAGALEVFAGIVILALTSLFTLKVSAKIFSFYALSYSKPKWREVIASIF
ncbi:ABC-2 type transporter [Ferroglobus placidus DSM 10642]|uniref:ABC-2 type transporter n=1 Tax=Ferroglobus placidus (strain DSM 10642 / AEDII12DO) TaxID=589924 RepID=D3RXN6_FERPA|nr:ABC transporter permease [Ferroglobus placidus]ADC65249.1 ABC-2 type transporter [Ferroglobus placidus DSM 10642]